MSIIEKALAKQQSKAPEVKPSTPEVSAEPVIEPSNASINAEENS